MKHFFDYTTTLLCNFQWLATLMALWNGFFSRSSVFHYRKLGLYVRNSASYVVYAIRFYYLFIMDKTFGRLQLELIDPLKQVFKIFTESVAILVLLFEIIEKIPNKELQKALFIASIILVIKYAEKRIEQIDLEEGETEFLNID